MRRASHRRSALNPPINQEQIMKLETPAADTIIATADSVVS